MYWLTLFLMMITLFSPSFASQCDTITNDSVVYNKNKHLKIYVNKNNQYALIHKKNKTHTGYIFNQVIPTPGMDMITIKNAQYGLVNKHGATVFEPIHKKISYVKDNSYEVIPFSKWYTFDTTENKNPMLCDSVVALSDNIILNYINSYIKITDALGFAITNQLYDNVKKLNEKYIVACLRGNCTLFDTKWNKVIEEKFYEYKSDHEGIIHVLAPERHVLAYETLQNTLSKRWELYLPNGERYINKQFFATTFFSENLMAVMDEDSSWYYIDREGKDVFEKRFSYATPFLNGTAYVEIKKDSISLKAIIDRNGKYLWTNIEAVMYRYGLIRNRHCGSDIREGEPLYEVHFAIPPYRYTSIQPEKYGYFKVYNKDKIGIIDAEGNTIVYEYQDTIYPSSSDTFFLFKRKNGLTGCADKYGNYTLPLTAEFDSVEPLQCRLSKFKKDNLYGFIDPYGNVVIAPKYSDCLPFSDEMAAVYLRGKWGYIDKNESLSVQPYYKQALPFRNGAALVLTQSGKWIFINKTGKTINSTQYDAVYTLSNGKYLLKRRERYGLADSCGKEILFPKYEYLQDLEDSLILVRRDGLLGVVDYHENIIVPFAYQKIIYDPFNRQFYVCREFATPFIYSTDTKKKKKK
ncbi:MAG: WG repeat-containing protein [Cytophagaceae bacterium]|nr:WG repeat-containing protein [Cytophagaceae bacterium]MDW8455354.1 WG repeat-containing protein [Cytophagaceae bacterium]